MIPGRMYRLSDGTEFEFSAERSSGTGMMLATNLKTGERLAGRYTGMYVNGGQSQTTSVDMWGNTVGSVTNSTPPTKAIAKGILRGDQGTVISVSLDINVSFDPNVNPTAFGEGKDNKGASYQIQIGGSYPTPAQ